MNMVNVAKIMASSNPEFYLLESSTAFIRLYRQDGTSTEYNTFDVNPKKLSDWAFHSSRSILFPVNTQFNDEYVQNQKEFPHVLAFMDHSDHYAMQAETLLIDLCSRHSKALLCVRVTKDS